MKYEFIKNNLYSRKMVKSIIGHPEPDTVGGVWGTGYVSFEDAYFIFANIDTKGRTGHNYPNTLINNELNWYAKNNISIHTPMLKKMMNNESEVYIFTRNNSSNVEFTFQGMGYVKNYKDSETANIVWGFKDIKYMDFKKSNLVQLRKIDATEAIFKATKEKHIHVFEDFREYAEQLTIQAGKAKKKSGKASSYARYLISTIVLYESIFKDEIDDLTSFEGVKKVEKITQLDEFKQFNSETNHFFSAAISCFSSYVVSKYNIEEKVDALFNEELNDLDEVEVEIDLKSPVLITTAQKRKEKQVNNGMKSYPRSEVESIAAKEKNDWQCEIDATHETFINMKNKKPFVEGHHLIPMAAQSYFEHTIDFADNIVTLCPTCHRKIHFALEAERKEMIKKLYEPRKDLYSGYGIEIDMKNLLRFNQIKP